MQVSKAIEIWLDYHKSNSRENTRKAYQVVLSNFSREFGERDVREITSDEVPVPVRKCWLLPMNDAHKIMEIDSQTVHISTSVLLSRAYDLRSWECTV